MIKKLLAFSFIAIVSVFSIGCKEKSDYVIKVETPQRPAGVENVLGLTNEPMDTVRVGFIGLGMRGPGAVYRFTFIPETKIVALCDIDEYKVDAVQKQLAERGRPAAASYAGSEDAWKQLCDRDDIDLVYICTDWKHHVPMALYAMEKGKHVAIEVPAAHTLKDIWALIDMSEKTRKHCMMLENCCYDFFELSALAMAQSGVMGEIIHAQGSYHHNLDPFWKSYWNNWRLEFNKENRGDIYPTHGLGPVCQVMNIHRGDRFKTLVAMDTKSYNGAKLEEARTGTPCNDFQNGDMTSTLIKTELGKTILIQHDVMTPRPYDRMYQLVGTDGYAAKYPVRQICLREESLSGKHVAYDNLKGEKVLSGGQVDSLLTKYKSPIITPELESLAKTVGGHGGMDFIMDYRLVYCLRKGLPLDMDVYDMAEWCCLSELGKISLENGCAPVEVPDFTRGAWKKIQGFKYAL